jgi:hypothetical protein
MELDERGKEKVLPPPPARVAISLALEDSKKPWAR